MSTNHGEILMQKPISEYARYIRNLIPANIPETYALKPMFESIAKEEDILIKLMISHKPKTPPCLTFNYL